MKVNSKAIKAKVEEKAIRLHVLEGLSGYDVGKELGMSSTEVFRILERHKIKRRQRKSVIAQRIKEMYINGYCIGEICSCFGLSKLTVEIILYQNKKSIFE
ncbi:hypothetical protein [Mesobacillus stamsii]|uniref:DNA-directed RNA polymerase specialized sigma24 family protein n=1 Tax=Mesobacillus stamsii TaxID=225347 RepID=A0ABU0FSY7_9BACI|nr:hypothetical protein [Mesobacillus stamsii]MDQ0413024.1 DNA-directed RNA polymerase specialized sigma24 family protein [Mesobacillus stamsii]